LIVNSNKLADLTGADCFVLALSRMMKSQGQNGLIGQTQLELDGIPDIATLKEAASRFGNAHPLLDARVRRNVLTMVPSWREDRRLNRSLNLNLWKEVGVLIEIDFPYKEVKTAHQIAEDLLNTPLDSQDGVRNLRLDLVLLKAGGSILVFTWNHLLFDGKGAELLVSGFIAATKGEAIAKYSAKPERSVSLVNQVKKARPATDRFFELVSNNYLSLSGNKPGPCLLRYKLLKFDQESSKKIQERAVGFSGIFSISFYLACAARAHRKAFLSRNSDPSHYVCSIPVQVRRKGGNSDPFQNRVTVLFFLLKKEDMDTMQDAVDAAQCQFEEMTRKELGPSFEMILRLMRRLPSYFYLKFLGTQFSGRITSFFHSSTGAFTLDKASLCGVRVVDAYHVPSVSAPPGSGLFFSESHGRLTAVLSWRDGAVTETEADLILQQVKHDLTGLDLE
jgi:hypothetical protein